MPWARLDDRFPSNRKIRLISDRAFRLYVSAICWSSENLTDGFVGETELRLVADIRGAKAAAEELVEAGLWVPSTRVRAAVVSSSRRGRAANASSSRRGRVEVGDTPDDTKVAGWEIHDYHEYNPTAEQVKAERAAKSARQQRWREKKKGGAPDPQPPNNTRVVDASVDASQDASRDGTGDAAPRARIPDPTRPVPEDVVDVGGETAGSEAAGTKRPDGLAPIDTDGFRVTDGMRRWAHRDGYAALVDIDHSTAQFVSHYRSTGTRRKSWPDAWQKWIRDDAKRAAERAARPTQGTFLVALDGGNQPPTQPLTGTDATVAGWHAVAAQLAAHNPEEGTA